VLHTRCRFHFAYHLASKPSGWLLACRNAGSLLANVEIATVDGFQGREADVVVFSAVRCNDTGSVGFLSDPRRLNVAFTRPRRYIFGSHPHLIFSIWSQRCRPNVEMCCRGLVVVASPRTLTHDKTWRSWVQWAREMGAVSAPLNNPLESQAAIKR